MTNLAVHFSSAKSDWETPREVFEPLDAEFHFTLDAAANAVNAKCGNFISEGSLSKLWDAPDGGAVWLNPPYGRGIGKWVKKAYEESQRVKVVCLLPARTDTRWFHEYCAHGEVRLLKGRIKFIQTLEDGSRGQKAGAPFPSMVVIFDRRLYNEHCPRIMAWYP